VKEVAGNDADSKKMNEEGPLPEGGEDLKKLKPADAKKLAKEKPAEFAKAAADTATKDVEDAADAAEKELEKEAPADVKDIAGDEDAERVLKEGALEDERAPTDVTTLKPQEAEKLAKEDPTAFAEGAKAGADAAVDKSAEDAE